MKYSNIHLAVTAFVYGMDRDASFGLICNQQANSDSFYYFVIRSTGEYVIGVGEPGRLDKILTNEGAWKTSGRITKNAASYPISADCKSDGTLTLYVDGLSIDSVVDKTFKSGGVGVIVWSGETAADTDVSFDNFKVIALP